MVVYTRAVTALELVVQRFFEHECCAPVEDIKAVDCHRGRDCEFGGTSQVLPSNTNDEYLVLVPY